MNKKGFTIFETIVVVAVFSALMMIVLGCWTEFQRVSIKNEGKQDANVQFVKIYRNIDKVVSSSSVRLFSSCDDGDLLPSDLKSREDLKGLRWSAFMISRDTNQMDGMPVYQDRSGQRFMIYNTCVIFLLHYDSNCCGGNFNNCPHKSLYRYVIRTSENVDFESFFTAGQAFEKILNNDVKNILNNHTASTYSVVANNIVDFIVDRQEDKLQYYVTLLRTEDAKRHFEIGKKNLVNPDSETKKYLEHLSWISIPSNT